MAFFERRYSNGGGRGRGQGWPLRERGQGGSSGGGRPFRAPHRNTLGSDGRTRNIYWQTDLFEDSLKAAGMSGVETGTKLYVSNLAFGVNNEDIRELFSEFGELIRYAIHYDKNGRPSGSADLIYARRSDALQAQKRYNNVQLDGKPMKIEIIGGNAEILLSARVNVVGGENERKRTEFLGSGPIRTRGGFTAAINRGGFTAATYRGFSGGRQMAHGGSNNGFRGGSGLDRGGGRDCGGANWNKKSVVKLADELDKELENYHAGAAAMET